MKFKTRPGKKRRTIYLPKERKGKKKTTKTNKKRKSMKSYQTQYSSLERQLARNPRNLAAAIRLIAKEQKLSREMKEFKEMRTAEIQRQMEELENKDRSRRRGANKNKWSEADVKKYSKLREELLKLNPNKTMDWKLIDVSDIIGKKKYTKGQIKYAKAMKAIEEKLGKVAADLKLKYGSDDIEELANQYYISDLSGYSEEELRAIEADFNKTHGYQIRLEKATNPFTNIDFLSM